MAKQKFERKVNCLVMLEEPEIKFLDRKINPKIEKLASRSAMIRGLIRLAMEKPALLD